MDADRSGYLEAPELAGLTIPMGADANNDGLLSWPEYRSRAR
jgi:hypothetical protein